MTNPVRRNNCPDKGYYNQIDAAAVDVKEVIHMYLQHGRKPKQLTVRINLDKADKPQIDVRT